MVPINLPSCSPIPDAQHNKSTLSASTSLHIFGKNTRMCSPTARSIHYLHCFHHQLHRHVLAQNDKVQALPCLCWRGGEDPPWRNLVPSAHVTRPLVSFNNLTSRISGQAAKYDWMNEWMNNFIKVSGWFAMAARIVEFWPSLERNFSGIGCSLEAKTTVSNSIHRFWSDLLL